jgi:hypothetical protein
VKRGKLSPARARVSKGSQICISASHDFRTKLLGRRSDEMYDTLALAFGVAGVVALMCLAFLLLD